MIFGHHNNNKQKRNLINVVVSMESYPYLMEIEKLLLVNPRSNKAKHIKIGKKRKYSNKEII